MNLHNYLNKRALLKNDWKKRNIDEMIIKYLKLKNPIKIFFYRIRINKKIRLYDNIY
jgi:hypothetical protein